MAIPLTLHDSLMARLDRLGNAKSVAQIGAVVGRVFESSLIAEIDDRSVAELDTALRCLTDADLIVRQGEDTYAFKHALVRDAAHESLLLRRRRELHGRVADALAGHQGTLPEVLASHYAEAMRIAEAIDHWKRAGEMAVARSANIEAIDHLENALRMLRQLAEIPTALAVRSVYRFCWVLRGWRSGLARPKRVTVARMNCAVNSATPSAFPSAARPMLSFVRVSSQKRTRWVTSWFDW